MIYIYSAPHPYRIFNTWAGDPSKLILLERVIQVIRAQNLLSLVRYSGTCLKKGLHELEVEFPNLISNVRGRGTMLAFSCTTVDIRDNIHRSLLCHGKCIKIVFYFNHNKNRLRVSRTRVLRVLYNVFFRVKNIKFFIAKENP